MSGVLQRRESYAKLIDLLPSDREIVQIEDSTRFGVNLKKKLRTVTMMLHRDAGHEVRDYDPLNIKGPIGYKALDFSYTDTGDSYGSGALGSNSVTFGRATTASGIRSLAIGHNTLASGENSFASGEGGLITIETIIPPILGEPINSNMTSAQITALVNSADKLVLNPDAINYNYFYFEIYGEFSEYSNNLVIEIDVSWWINNHSSYSSLFIGYYDEDEDENGIFDGEYSIALLVKSSNEYSFMKITDGDNADAIVDSFTKDYNGGDGGDGGELFETDAFPASDDNKYYLLISKKTPSADILDLYLKANYFD